MKIGTETTVNHLTPLTGTKPLVASEAQLRTKMLGMIGSNFTHQARLVKSAPGSTVNNSLEEAKAEHKLFVNALMMDETKTDGMRVKLAAEHANNMNSKVLKVVDAELRTAGSLARHLGGRVENTMKVSGTTDLLLRQQQAALIQNMGWAEVLATIKSGCVETAKCLSLPLMQHKFNLKADPKRAAALTEVVQQVVLGKDYDNFVQASAIGDALTDAGDAVMQRVESNQATIDNIARTIVTGAEA